MVTPQILPEALQSPNHVQLAIRNMFEEAVAHEPDDVLPVAVPFVGDFFLQYGADGNHRGKGIPEDQELQKKLPARNADRCREDDGCDAHNLHNRGEQFKEPQIGKREAADSSVARAKQDVAIRPQDVQ